MRIEKLKYLTKCLIYFSNVQQINPISHELNISTPPNLLPLNKTLAFIHN